MNECWRHLPAVCDLCGSELILSPSGHQFCIYPPCTNGFDVTRDFGLMQKLGVDMDPKGKKQ
jgi:hypothetical protein